MIVLTGKTVSDPNAVWAAYYAAQAQPAYPAYQAAVQPTLQSVTGQQPAPYAATLSRAAVTPQPSIFYFTYRPPTLVSVQGSFEMISF